MAARELTCGIVFDLLCQESHEDQHVEQLFQVERSDANLFGQTLCRQWTILVQEVIHVKLNRGKKALEERNDN